jgi:hypothetical protein
MARGAGVRQFRVLYREHLFRLVDTELLSTAALGDTSKLAGRFASLLLIVGVFLALPAIGFGAAPLRRCAYSTHGVPSTF